MTALVHTELIIPYLLVIKRMRLYPHRKKISAYKRDALSSEMA